jgi:uncharacterized membrane protein
MKKNTLFWITGIVLVAVLLLFVPSMLMFGRGSSMHSGGYGMMGNFDNNNAGPGSSMMDGYGGYGMMGGGWMAFGWIIPVVILILIIAAGVWLGNTLSNRTLSRSNSPDGKCSNCNTPVDADWVTCPYCSTTI